MRDDEYEGIRAALAATAENIRRRLHKHGGVMPLWLGRELELYGRKCFRNGVERAHEAPTNRPPSGPFDDEPTPPRSLWDDDGK